jgi:hypothetical protein
VDDVSATYATMRGRAAAETLMVDTCTITRAGSGDPVYNEADDTYTYPTASTSYTGKCRVRPAGTQDVDHVVGADPVWARSYIVSVPVSETNTTVDDVVTITASALDPALVGQRLRVQGVLKGSHITARRLACEVLSD